MPLLEPYQSPCSTSCASRCGWSTGSRCSITWSSRVKIPALAPIPSARERIAMEQKTGDFASVRQA